MATIKTGIVLSKTLNINLPIILQSQLTRYSFIISLFCFLASIIIMAVKFTSLPPEIPLFYSRPWGEGRLAPTHMALILPGTIMLLILLNLIIISKFGLKFLTKIMALSMAITSFLLFWTLAKIVFTIS